MGQSSSQFVQELTQSGLMSAAEVTSFQQSLAAGEQPGDGETLARALVQAGKLTKYQAAAVYQGKTKGLVFDEYVVLDKIGQGGMGTVYKATHRRMQRVVAIKVLPRSALRSPHAVERFYHEAAAAAKLSHPNIVTAHDAREHSGMHFLVMEYVEGQDLAALVQQRGRLPVGQAVEYMLQTARGLQYAHGRGVIHRDIKPENLLLDREGTIKYLDMGIARIADPSGLTEPSAESRLTQSGQVMGTCDYMAPEQALDSRQADQRADIYALGCTLYHLVSGHPPYTGQTFTQLFVAHRESPIPSLRATHSEVPEGLDALCQKMLAKRPEDRYQSAAEVIEELEKYCLSGAGLEGGGSLAATSRADTANLHQAPRAETAPDYESLLAAEGLALDSVPHGGRQSSQHTRPLLQRIGRRQKICGGVFLAAVGLVLVFGILLTLRTREGTLVVELSDPDVTVQVLAKEGKLELEQKGQPGTITLSVDPGKHRLRVSKEGFDVFSQEFTLATGGRELIHAKLEKPGASSKPQVAEVKEQAAQGATSPTSTAGSPSSPSLAIAPFDAQKAKEHQEVWARHLGVPVELTNSIGMKFVLIPPGEFTMGASTEEMDWAIEQARAKNRDSWYPTWVRSEGPQHTVRISKAFYLGIHEVTQLNYESIIGTNPSAFSHHGESQMHVAGRDTRQHPVENVNWNDAVEFCRQLSISDGERRARRTYRLPTEAEWEYSCRAGTRSRWYTGDDIEGLEASAWIAVNSDRTTHPVGQKRPNAWGLYDMYGNVWEWGGDWYLDRYYQESPPVDPRGPVSGTNHVIRGACWLDPALFCRSAVRSLLARGGLFLYGFRAVLDIPAARTDDRELLNAKVEKPVLSSNPSMAAANKPAAREASGSDFTLAASASPLAIAPFDAQKAKEYQETWAKYLGVPVETTNSIGMKLVLIPPGEFEMGSTPEEIATTVDEDNGSNELQGRVWETPRHHVTITNPFGLGMYAVTQTEYEKVMDLNPSAFAAKQMDSSAFKPPYSQSAAKYRRSDGEKATAKDTSRLPVETVSWEEAVEFCRKLSVRLSHFLPAMLASQARNAFHFLELWSEPRSG